MIIKARYVADNYFAKIPNVVVHGVKDKEFFGALALQALHGIKYRRKVGKKGDENVIDVLDVAKIHVQRANEISNAHSK